MCACCRPVDYSSRWSVSVSLSRFFFLIFLFCANARLAFSSFSSLYRFFYDHFCSLYINVDAAACLRKRERKSQKGRNAVLTATKRIRAWTKSIVNEKRSVKRIDDDSRIYNLEKVPFDYYYPANGEWKEERSKQQQKNFFSYLDKKKPTKDLFQIMTSVCC